MAVNWHFRQAIQYKTVLMQSKQWDKGVNTSKGEKVDYKTVRSLHDCNGDKRRTRMMGGGCHTI